MPDRPRGRAGHLMGVAIRIYPAARQQGTPLTRMQDTMRGLASRFVYKALDAVLTAHATDVCAASSHRSASNYRLVHSAARIASRHAPRLMRLVTRSLTRYDALPFRASRVSLMSFGTGATVFLLDYDDGGTAPARVLKVVRRTLGMRMDVLMSQMQEFRSRYQMVARWYESCQLIVPLQFLILRGPLLGIPAVACLQPFVTGRKWDFFEYGSDDELLALLRRSPRLREQFCRFAARTAVMVAETARCVDFVGRDNLLLVKTARGLRLQLIDYGVLDLRHIAVHAPPLHTRTRERLARVHRLHQALIGGENVAGCSPLIAWEA